MSASSGYGGGGSTPVGPVIETLTGNVGGAVGPTGNNINIIGAGGVLVTGNPGTSTLTITAPGEAASFPTDNLTATPLLGVLNIFGGASTAGTNIHTSAPGASNTVDVILNDSLYFPNTNSSGTEGVLYWGGATFVHNFGIGNNTFVGANAGNLSFGGGISGSENTGIGAGALNSLVASNINLGEANTALGCNALNGTTDGSWNVAAGNGAGFFLTTGQGNVLIGNEVAWNGVPGGGGTGLRTGNNNILIGGTDDLGVNSAGYNFTGAESSNIILQNIGTAGLNNTMLLGTDGSGAGQINATYVAGIYNRSFASPSGVVQIDHNFKLGSSAGTNGQLLIGSTGASPLWANLTSMGGTIVITNAPNAINLEATGTGAGASQFPTDLNGPADEAGGVLNIFGGPGILSGVNNIHTNAVALSNTVRVVLNDSLKFPITHADGSGGILYWNNVPAIQFYGTGNCFLGTGAGNLTLTTGSAIDNTAVGDNCLPALTTSPENTFIGSNSGTLLASGSGLNTAAGFGVLDNLVSGSNNIAIGTLAGTNYTTNESNNILLGSFGTVGDSQTIRIGRTQTAAYMEGIYNRSIGATNAPVFIDNTGKLGTISGGSTLAGSSLMAVVGPSDESLGTSTGIYFVGALQVMQIKYNNFGAAFSPGNGVGTGASFTAPIDGFYSINWQCAARAFLGLVSAAIQFNATIIVNSSIYYQVNNTGAGSNPSLPNPIYIQLTAADIVRFSITITSNSTGANLFITGGNGTNTAPYYSFITVNLLATAP